MEELFLGSFFPRQEMDVIDDQHIDMSVFESEAVQVPLLHGGDEVVDEGFAREKKTLNRRVLHRQLMANSLQVSLTTHFFR